MDQVVHWGRLEALISPQYTRQRKGRPQMPRPTMLRMYFLQQCSGLSGPGAQEVLYDMHSMRSFAGLDPGRDAIPDETTILNVRHLLEQHTPTEVLFGEVKTYLQEHTLLRRGGTIMHCAAVECLHSMRVDATLIAPSPTPSTKAGKRDPEMSQTKKANQWYFGARIHVGVDLHSGLVHTARLTKASRHDAVLTDDLIREGDRAVFGDKGHVSDKRKRAARADGVLWAVKDKRKRGRRLSSAQNKRTRKHGGVRAKVEHVFRVIKCQFGSRRVRYRGLARNAARMLTLTALAHLNMVRGNRMAGSV